MLTCHFQGNQYVIFCYLGVNLSLGVDFKSAFFLFPENMPLSHCGYSSLCILMEDLQASWKSKYGMRSPSYNLLH
jgi:hypothetical protein